MTTRPPSSGRDSDHQIPLSATTTSPKPTAPETTRSAVTGDFQEPQDAALLTRLVAKKLRNTIYSFN